MIEISEIYPALQGEGPNLGRQALFVRVHRCPLSCDWCDTKFTWDKNDPGYADFDSVTAPELARAMLGAAQALTPHEPMSVVFTGGEPMIYQKWLPEVIDLFRAEYRVPIEVETSGIIKPTLAMTTRCHFNVSQKLPSAGNQKVSVDKLFNVENTRLFAMGSSSFKVVVAPVDEDFGVPMYVAWLRKATEGVIPWHQLRTRVYLMPEGTTEEHISDRQGKIMKLAQQLGVCATTRMHVTAFDNARRR